MVLFNLAIKNIKKNIKDYRIYFMSIAFNIMIFYIFISIKNNEQVNYFLKGDIKTKILFDLASLVILFFSLMFISYCSNFFLKKRKKEIALYSILGLKKSQISKMLFCEQFILGNISLLIGLALGSIFLKFFIMMLIKIIKAKMIINMSFSINAIFQTVLVFEVLFLVVSIIAYFTIYRYKLVDLFKADKVSEKIQKDSKILAFISLLLIGVGYYFAITMKATSASFLVSVPVAFLATVIGTGLMFKYFIAIFLEKLKSNKKIYYKASNLIGINNLRYRIRSNTIMLFLVSIVTAVAITSLGITYSIQNFFEKLADSQFSYSISLEAKDENEVEKVNSIVNENKNLNLIRKSKIDILKYKLSKDNTFIVKESDLKKELGYKKINESFQLKNGEAIYLSNKMEKNLPIKEEIKSENLKIENLNLKINYRLNAYLMNAFQFGEIIIVSDYDFNKLESTLDKSYALGFKFENQENSKELSLQILKNISKTDNFSYFYETYLILVYISMMLFVGIFISILFLMASASMVHFRVLGQVAEDKERYLQLLKLGMDFREINKAIKIQVATMFFSPLLVGIFHSFIAIYMMYRALNINILSTSLITIILYFIVYVIYYKNCMINCRNLILKK